MIVMTVLQILDLAAVYFLKDRNYNLFCMINSSTHVYITLVVYSMMLCTMLRKLLHRVCGPFCGV